MNLPIPKIRDGKEEVFLISFLTTKNTKKKIPQRSYILKIFINFNHILIFLCALCDFFEYLLVILFLNPVNPLIP